MVDAISNTSPLLYLYRIGVVEWLPELFDEVWTPRAVVAELQEGRQRGYDVPDLEDYGWLQIVGPRSVPSEWLSLGLGRGELESMALALENPKRIVLLIEPLITRLEDSGMWISGDIRRRILALAGEETK